MRDILLAISIAATCFYGYFIIKKFDNYLSEMRMNKHASEIENIKKTDRDYDGDDEV